MKALFLTNEYPPNIYGGAGVHVDYLARELAKSIEVDVRCFGDQASREGNLTARGFQVDKSDFAACDAGLKSPLSAFSNCIAFNAEPVDAQIVHCHTWYTHFGGLLAKMGHGLPLVVTTHSLEPLRPWKKEQLGLGYDLSTWIEKTAMEKADAIIAVSQGMKQDVLNLFDIDENRIEVIYNGIDTEEFKPVNGTGTLSRYGIDPDVPFVLFVGRITRQKGIIHLVNAIRHIDENVQIVLCAGQPDTPEIGQEMNDRVHAVQRDRKNVVWISEWVDANSKIELYSHAAVFCCPSIYEPFGIINLEAMACATPVVGSAVGGIKEIILHGETGYLVPFEQHTESPFEAVNPEEYSRALADAINTILVDPDLGAAMGAASRKRAEQHFSWKAIALETLALYRKLL
ncbi:MAG: glycogen synthase [Sulfuritalea sp.]|nr:glycogen synthase [Sulfuritalea sp.]